MNDTQRCECGCGETVSPGCRFRRGHHLRTKKHRDLLTGNKVRRHRTRMEQRRDLGGIAEIGVKSARWDDTWSVVGEESLRDTAAVLETVGRYGYVEVSYALPAAEADPFLALDDAVVLEIEARHVMQLAAEFAEAGFTDLSPDEVKYLWLNYGSMEDFAA